MNFDSIWENQMLRPLKQISAKPKNLMERPHLHSFFPQNFSFNNNYVLFVFTQANAFTEAKMK